MLRIIEIMESTVIRICIGSFILGGILLTGYAIVYLLGLILLLTPTIIVSLLIGTLLMGCACYAIGDVVVGEWHKLNK